MRSIANGPVHRLCPLYLRDVFGFLPRLEVERMRAVSSNLEEVVRDCPTRLLPRQRLISLRVERTLATHSRADVMAGDARRDWNELDRGLGRLL